MADFTFYSLLGVSTVKMVRKDATDWTTDTVRGMIQIYSGAESKTVTKGQSFLFPGKQGEINPVHPSINSTVTTGYNTKWGQPIIKTGNNYREYGREEGMFTVKEGSGAFVALLRELLRAYAWIEVNGQWECLLQLWIVIRREGAEVVGRGELLCLKSSCFWMFDGLAEVDDCM